MLGLKGEENGVPRANGTAEFEDLFRVIGKDQVGERSDLVVHERH